MCYFCCPSFLNLPNFNLRCVPHLICGLLCTLCFCLMKCIICWMNCTYKQMWTVYSDSFLLGSLSLCPLYMNSPAGKIACIPKKKSSRIIFCLPFSTLMSLFPLLSRGFDTGTLKLKQLHSIQPSFIF